MATLRELKGRIGSVGSSEKITGAMKMISSAKMHKAEATLKRLAPFRDCVQTIIGNLLSSDAVVSSPLTAERTACRRVAIIVLGSDDGLCGAYNVNIFKAMLDTLASLRAEAGENVEIDLYPVGKKMVSAISKIAARDPHITMVTTDNVNSKSDGDDIKQFAEHFNKRFLAGEVDRVMLDFMSFRSAGKQIFAAEQYLPVSSENLGNGGKSSGRPYLFEPDAATIFSTVLPMYLLSQMQEAFAQNRASEQAARVMAMQSANDNAHKLLEQLQLEYNKLRQQSITTELLDIVGGQKRD
ncbi:MAG: ATP synthase F1 subunit gamma [Muribaculaceae bacterium]|nr:ATP synthase F1 subunit gamma [Muribaculaceae bacterium]